MTATPGQPAPVSPDLECTACAPGVTSPHGVPATPGQAAYEVAEAPFRVWMHEVGHDPDDMRTYYGVGAMAEAFQGGTQAAIAAQEPEPAPELAAAMAETRQLRDLLDQATKAVQTKRWALTETEKRIIRGFRQQAGLPS